MSEILHIADRTDWESVRSSGGPYETSTRGRTLAEEGFIHCSSNMDQAQAVLSRFYSDADDLVLLVIDTDRLDVPLRYEEADGELFPHIYGPIPLTAVIGVRPLPETR